MAARGHLWLHQKTEFGMEKELIYFTPEGSVESWLLGSVGEEGIGILLSFYFPHILEKLREKRMLPVVLDVQEG